MQSPIRPPYLNKRGISTGNRVTDAELEAYRSNLEKRGLACRTQYLAGNTLKAIVALLIETVMA